VTNIKLTKSEGTGITFPLSVVVKAPLVAEQIVKNDIKRIFD
jgi:hypothetical protein